MKKLLAMLLALSLSCTMLAGCSEIEDLIGGGDSKDEKEKVSSKKDYDKDYEDEILSPKK